MDPGGFRGLQIRCRVGDPAEVGSTPTHSRQNTLNLKIGLMGCIFGCIEVCLNFIKVIIMDMRKAVRSAQFMSLSYKEGICFGEGFTQGAESNHPDE